MKLKEGMHYLVFDADTRFTELVLGCLAFTVGFAFLLVGGPFGTDSDLAISGAALVISGPGQILGAFNGNARARIVVNATAWAAGFINLWRACAVTIETPGTESVVSVAYWGAVTLTCWVLWFRVWLVRNGAIEEGVSKAWTGSETSVAAQQRLQQRAYSRYCASVGYCPGSAARTTAETRRSRLTERRTERALRPRKI